MRSRQSTDALETSDVEITRVDNEPPHMVAQPAWHVHLELRPEQLLALHRMGFTGGALAWREGMDDWQPLRVGGEPGDELNEPSTSAPLARVTPLATARRRSHRDSANPPPPPARPPARVTPFAQTRASVPPIINALPMPLVRVRRPAEPAPPSPALEGRIPPAPLPSFSADAMATLPGPPLDLSPRVAPLEPKPSSIPPMSLEPRANAPRASRAVMFGAVALVALSASNGALVSALLWKLRNEPALPAPSAAAEARQPAPPLGAAPIASPSASPEGATPDPGQPLSVDQLPLAVATRTNNYGSASSSDDVTETPSTRTTSSGTRPSSRRSGRRSPATVVLDEDRTSRARKTSKAESAPEPGPPDRRAISRAIGYAAGAASSCTSGPETGRVSVTFSPSGNVQSVSLLRGFGDAGINTCVMRAMGRAKVRPFTGTAITVQKTLKW